MRFVSREPYKSRWSGANGDQSGLDVTAESEVNPDLAIRDAESCKPSQDATWLKRFDDDQKYHRDIRSLHAVYFLWLDNISYKYRNHAHVDQSCVHGTHIP